MSTIHEEDSYHVINLEKRHIMSTASAKAIQESWARPLEDVLSKLEKDPIERYTTLDLTGNFIDIQCLEPLADFLEHHDNISTLELYYNKLHARNKREKEILSTQFKRILKVDTLHYICICGNPLVKEAWFFQTFIPTLKYAWKQKIIWIFDDDLPIEEFPIDVSDFIDTDTLEIHRRYYGIGFSHLEEGIPREIPPYDLTPVHEEMQYLHLVQKILRRGVERSDRTGVGTKSIFGAQMRFSLEEDVFPLLTTKRIFWRGVVEELLWFIRGSTDAKELSEKGVHIWEAHSSLEFLAKQGLDHREEGDVGPMYGFQWRHFGAEYVDKKTDYAGKGVDQLADCIERIRKDPTSRRILMTAWNPSVLSDMALAPCHILCQFYVSEGALSCLLYQRSADMGLGVPFNIASYALLTRMVAHVCGLQAKELIHMMGDAHVYLNHLEGLQEQRKRKPYSFPTLKIVREVSSIDDFKWEDFELRNYQFHPALPLPLAV